ncbi:hypothetical protein BDN70DRAFT_165272 [Pholiota conissans]|uniref:Uncharacterized protein n=1 Tax=Pholiota conissans TaxID=109636 RepID=A0A9P5YVQ4_9AGAR|nr:hypothetical protein BDN70DRAFT_165272 [Pholiota conissans]
MFRFWDGTISSPLTDVRPPSSIFAELTHVGHCASPSRRRRPSNISCVGCRAGGDILADSGNGSGLGHLFPSNPWGNVAHFLAMRRPQHVKWVNFHAVVFLFLISACCLGCFTIFSWMSWRILEDFAEV